MSKPLTDAPSYAPRYIGEIDALQDMREHGYSIWWHVTGFGHLNNATAIHGTNMDLPPFQLCHWKEIQSTLLGLGLYARGGVPRLRSANKEAARSSERVVDGGRHLVCRPLSLTPRIHWAKHRAQTHMPATSARIYAQERRP